MERKWPLWLIPALAVGIIGFGLYGFNQQQNRQALVLSAENQYRGNFHYFTSHLGEMQDALAGALVTTSAKSIQGELAAAVRQAYAASVNLENLPANLTRKGSLISYLTNTTAYLDKLQLDHANGKSFSTTEQHTLKRIYSQTAKLLYDSRKLQTNLLQNTNSPRFLSALAARGQDPELQKQFDGIDGAAKQMLSENHVKHLDALQTTDTAHAYLTQGAVVSSNQAVNIAKAFLGYSGPLPNRVQNLGSGFAYPGYLVTLLNGDKETDRIAVSRHRGVVVFMSRALMTPPNTNKALSLPDAQRLAEKFLQTHHFPAVTLLQSLSTPQGISFSFARVQGGIAIEPQTVLIKVNPVYRQVTDFDASAYYAYQQSQYPLRPQISAKQALQQLNPNFQVADERLAIVLDAANKPTLVYEILGRLANNTYEILVDATTGEQMEITKINKD